MVVVGACRETSRKPIAFRPSPKTDDFIKAYMKQHPTLTQSLAVNRILESIGKLTEKLGKNIEEIGASPFLKTLVMCRNEGRLVQADYCEHDCKKIVDCSMFLELKEYKERALLDVQPKKEE